MATRDDVAQACLALPATTELRSASGRRRWLVRLDRLARGDLRELAVEARAARAPRRLVAEHLPPPPEAARR